MSMKVNQADTPHPKRQGMPSGRRPSAQEVLDRNPLGTVHWRVVLGALLKLHNIWHSTRDKTVSNKTREDRRRFLFSFFEELRKETRFKIEPRQLGGRHVQVMVQRWIDRGLGVATIHNYLSFLRTFGSWIGKPGMVREVSYYVGSSSPYAHRDQVAKTDKSWTTVGVDVDAVIGKVTEVDGWVGLQLQLCRAFGMRPKEARHFRPHEAERTRAQAIAADVAAHPGHETFVRIEYGTKGGRARDVPLATDGQRELLAHLKTVVLPGGYVGDPAKTAKQNGHRFYYVARKCGVSKKELGVVAHGLRHQMANDCFEDEAGVPSPVRGGGASMEVVAGARHRVARMLGHGRERAAAFYIGSNRSVMAGQQGDSAEAGHEDEAPPL